LVAAEAVIDFSKHFIERGITCVAHCIVAKRHGWALSAVLAALFAGLIVLEVIPFQTYLTGIIGGACLAEFNARAVAVPSINVRLLSNEITFNALIFINIEGFCSRIRLKQNVSIIRVRVTFQTSVLILAEPALVYQSATITGKGHWSLIRICVFCCCHDAFASGVNGIQLTVCSAGPVAVIWVINRCLWILQYYDPKVPTLLMIKFIVPSAGLTVTWGATDHQEVLGLNALFTVCCVITNITSSVPNSQAFSASLCIKVVTKVKVRVVGTVNTLVLAREKNSYKLIGALRILLAFITCCSGLACLTVGHTIVALIVVNFLGVFHYKKHVILFC
jgi:hypothetical protein